MSMWSNKDDSKMPESTKPFKTAARNTIREYCQESNLTYLKYNAERGATQFQRVLFTFSPLVAGALSGLLVYLLWERFAESPIMYTEQAPTSVRNVPFPAVTLCHPQNVVDEKAAIFASNICSIILLLVSSILVSSMLEYSVKLIPFGMKVPSFVMKMPSNISREEVIRALYYLRGFSYPFTVPIEGGTMEMLQQVLEFNRYTVSIAMKELTMTCDDMLVTCQWSEETGHCRRAPPYHFWRVANTHLGACCSFNYRKWATKDFVALSVYGNEIAMGLNVLLTPRLSSKDFQGLKLLIHNPLDYPSETAILSILPVGRELLVRVSPKVLYASEAVLSLPFAQRKCVDKYEVPLPPHEDYRVSLCMVKCQMSKMMRFCGCVPYNFPQEEFPECNATRLQCIMKHYVEIHDLRQCNCPIVCHDVRYEVNTITGDLGAIQYFDSDIYAAIDTKNRSKELIMLHVFLAKQFVSRLENDVVLTWIHLLSSLGGVFNLCLGCSLLTAIELFYYFKPRLYMNYAAQNQAILNKDQTFTTVRETEK